MLFFPTYPGALVFVVQSTVNIEQIACDLRKRVNYRLADIVAGDAADNKLDEALRYALLSPGKRLRPLVCIITAQCLNGDIESAIDPACAIEMIHTASLIVDDLPCMDDAVARRGQPSCHRRFGEATTILVALELMSLGYRVMSQARNLDPARQMRLVQTLAHAVGLNGLIGGQELDLSSTSSDAAAVVDSRAVTRMHELKTGALFVAAAESGGIVAGLAGDQLLPIRSFAARLGLAYQAFDDLLDAHATVEETGKDTHQDADKPTLVSLMGSDAAASYATKMVAAAISELRSLGPDMRPLESLVTKLISRPAALNRALN